MNSNAHFDYNQAFSRNIGWFSDAEQHILKGKKIAIAGLGGVGGIHLLSLVRAGIENFHIADMDHFELANFNRQIGATISSLQKPKAEILYQMAKDINPNVKIKIFSEGVMDSNLEDFLNDVDLFVDGFDYFVLDMRIKTFEKCHQLEIPAITAAPIGFSTAYLIATPESMSFKEYFNFHAYDYEDQLILFLLGLNPFGKQLSYLSEPSKIDFKNKITSSNIAACELCAGVVTTEAVKILLHRGNVKPLPYAHLIDPYNQTFICKKLTGGNKNIKQKLKLYLFKKNRKNKIKDNLNSVFSENIFDSSCITNQKNLILSDDLRKILEYAIYAPSGDNKQPWKFKIVDNNNIQVILKYKENFFEKNLLSISIVCGALIKNLKIAASYYGYSLNILMNELDNDENLKEKLLSIFKKNEINNNKKSSNEEIDIKIDVEFLKTNTEPSELIDFIKTRSVSRKLYKKDKINSRIKNELSEKIEKNQLKLIFIDSKEKMQKMTNLSLEAYNIRMSSKESYELLQQTFDFKNNNSYDKTPISTINLDHFSKKMFPLLLKNWNVFKFLNKILGFGSRFQIDYLPNVFSGAHFIIAAEKNLDYTDSTDFFPKMTHYGEAVQEFWLETTRVGLCLQPNFLLAVIPHYIQQNIPFIHDVKNIEKAKNISTEILALTEGKMPIFIGRIGWPHSRKIEPRSLRLPLEKFII